MSKNPTRLPRYETEGHINRKLLFLLAGLLVFGAVLGPGLSYSITNCGGNSAALAQVQSIALIARAGTFDTPDHSFRFTAVDADQREQLTHYSRTHWLRNARFLVSIDPVLEHEAQPRRIIVVCDTPYRNVPRRWIGSAPPTHAAGFSDGSHGLISTAEFAALDRSKFTPLDKMYPPKAK